MGRFKSRHGAGGRPTKGMGRSIRHDAHQQEDRVSPSGPPPETIHLRQLRVVEAMEKLKMMIELHHRRGTRELLIVHGKGLQSEGGQPVIGPLVREWCEAHPGIIKTWKEAPRDWGGAGAIVIKLRQVQE